MKIININSVSVLYRTDNINLNFAVNSFSKDNLIDAIVRTKYTQSMVEAIFSNYLGNMEDEQYKAEFEDFQNWRKEAKDIANDIFNHIDDYSEIYNGIGIYVEEK